MLAILFLYSMEVVFYFNYILILQSLLSGQNTFITSE